MFDLLMLFFVAGVFATLPVLWVLYHEAQAEDETNGLPDQPAFDGGGGGGGGTESPYTPPVSGAGGFPNSGGGGGAPTPLSTSPLSRG
ncbi:MAG: hypothetical protein HY719_09375 [Planctomycetes bacterium]|nr:hypothetical protein [Planctomycetota bacterium]